jgi:hypothetical protein
MLALVGNAPSSGSTFFADLIDASDHAFCGNELELFCQPAIYHPVEFARNPETIAPAKQIYATGIFPKFERLDSYKLDKDDLLNLAEEATSFEAFSESFSGLVLKRNGIDSGVVFEKTPQNLNCIGEYLEAHPNGTFVSIIRNPLYVYSSMRRRGFGPYAASATWLVDLAQLWPFLNHERVKVIRYEDLVQKPFRITAQLINDVAGGEIANWEQIEEAYYSKRFHSERKSKIKSWSVSERGVIRNANDRQLPIADLEVMKTATQMSINPAFARRFDLPDLDFKTAIAHFGYEEAVDRNLHSINGKTIKKDRHDTQKLLAKWYRGWRAGEYRFSDWPLLNKALV